MKIAGSAWIVFIIEGHPTSQNPQATNVRYFLKTVLQTALDLQQHPRHLLLSTSDTAETAMVLLTLVKTVSARTSFFSHSHSYLVHTRGIQKKETTNPRVGHE